MKMKRFWIVACLVCTTCWIGAEEPERGVRNGRLSDSEIERFAREGENR